MLELFKISFFQIFSRFPSIHNKFIMYFSIISLSLCISILIIISSLTEGFNDKISQKISSIDGHYRINNSYNKSIDLDDLNILKKTISSNPSFSEYSSYTENYAMIKIGDKSEGIILYGVEENKIPHIFDIPNFKKEKSKDNYVNIIIGEKLAKMYNLELNSSFFIFNINDFSQSNIKAIKVIVSNIFSSGFSEYDKSVCFVSLEDSQKLFDYGSSCSGIIGRVNSPMEINENFSIIFKDINMSKYNITTWIDRHSSIIKWLNAYSQPIKLIVYSIIFLAVFNMSLSLWILVQDKLSEISILFTLGLSRIKIALLVIFQNLVLNIISIFLSIIISLTFLYIQYNYHFIRIKEEVYFLEYIPVLINYYDIIFYCIFLLMMSFVISLIPAYKLYYINPIKYIKND